MYLKINAELYFFTGVKVRQEKIVLITVNKILRKLVNFHPPNFLSTRTIKMLRTPLFGHFSGVPTPMWHDSTA